MGNLILALLIGAFLVVMAISSISSAVVARRQVELEARAKKPPPSRYRFPEGTRPGTAPGVIEDSDDGDQA